MYASIDLDFLNKNLEQAKKRSIEDLGEADGAKFAQFPDGTFRAEVCEFEVNDENISISFDTELGFITVDIPMNVQIQEAVLSATIRKMNKIKSLLETLK